MIVRTPAQDAHGYRIRFPDGSEASLRRAQFGILRSMKESGLREAGEAVEVDWQRYVIYKCIVGSRAFGLDNDESPRLDVVSAGGA